MDKSKTDYSINYMGDDVCYKDGVTNVKDQPEEIILKMIKLLHSDCYSEKSKEELWKSPIFIYYRGILYYSDVMCGNMYKNFYSDRAAISETLYYEYTKYKNEVNFLLKKLKFYKIRSQTWKCKPGEIKRYASFLINKRVPDNIILKHEGREVFNECGKIRLQTVIEGCMSRGSSIHTVTNDCLYDKNIWKIVKKFIIC